MKRTILALLIVTIVYSCKDDNVVMSREEYNKLTNLPPKEYPKPFSLLNEDDLEIGEDGILLGSDNHDYLVRNYYTNWESVSHYVDCKECFNRRSLINR